MEEERRLEEARLAEEAALAIAEQDKAKSRAALEAAEAARRIAELESQKIVNAEMKVLKKQTEKKAHDALASTDFRYRKYTIEEVEAATEFFSEALKIGEGGYGPVFKVYAFMAYGSLEDRLFGRGNTPTLSRQLRFRIAAEIRTALLFLHQTKPEPIVHRDLKPANILIDRNFVSKISDVGLARLVPPSVADSVTQYRRTATAGTFCCIDPEYQQTGMLGVKSDTHLGKVVLPELNRLISLAEEAMQTSMKDGSPGHSPSYSQASLGLEESSFPNLANSDKDSTS
ncbi:DNA topoisomerase isoform 1 [Hibiscus syriacus]|uniref:RING-type E3 ubiquitin transferase n=1 Tax=Hibiscus syriacus TaxID=106335 RepID=A0A6A2ZIJ0_HIBSY|nr:DNA topoisomerase isoform 1 [Hibiscus syriacus]